MKDLSTSDMEKYAKRMADELEAVMGPSMRGDKFAQIAQWLYNSGEKSGADYTRRSVAHDQLIQIMKNEGFASITDFADAYMDLVVSDNFEGI